MTRTIFVAAALASSAFGLQPAAADYYGAPWCAVMAMGEALVAPVIEKVSSLESVPVPLTSNSPLP